MDNFSRINFWIVICCVCFPAKSLPIGVLRDSNIEWMKTAVTCGQDAKFYTPRNIKPECFTAALQCFQDELKTVFQECKSPENAIAQAGEFLKLQQNALKGGEPNSTVFPCESWPEEPFLNFLDAMESLLILIEKDQMRTT